MTVNSPLLKLVSREGILIERLHRSRQVDLAVLSQYFPGLSADIRSGIIRRIIRRLFSVPSANIDTQLLGPVEESSDIRRVDDSPIGAFAFEIRVEFLLVADDVARKERRESRFGKDDQSATARGGCFEQGDQAVRDGRAQSLAVDGAHLRGCHCDETCHVGEEGETGRKRQLKVR